MNNPTIAEQPVPFTCSSNVAQTSKTVLLLTAVVNVYDKWNMPHLCRVLLDTGSQVNFVTEELAHRLQLPVKPANVPITGINALRTLARDKVELKIRSRVSCYEVNLECLITPKVTGTIPTSNVNIDLSLLPIGTMLADPMFFKPQKVDMLIGAELFFEILRPNQLELAANMPMLRETHFGWIVSGTVEDPQEHVSTQRSCHASVEDVEEMMQRFWQVEEVPSASKLSKEELDCEAHFISTYQRDETGRFIVRLPFNESLDQLADCRALSLKRFLMQEKRLIRNTELQEQYKTFLEEYEALEHCREVREENDPPNRQVYYMPHHAVLRPSSSSTKCRVVFDASAKPSPSQLSLNDVLQVGPVVQNDLFSIVLRFRKFRIAFSADISKMYRQIRHAEDDQRFLRIFWRSDPAHPMRVLELCTVTYGTASAPYLATRCLVQLVEEDGGAFPSASRIVKEETYMDDVLSGASSVEAAIEAQQELKQLLLRGGFPIHKWCSNSTEFLEQIPEADREKKIQNAERDINETIKVLGVSWDPNADTLSVMNPTSPPTPTDPVKHHVTKRMLYAAIAKMFDPLGLVSPALVLAKLLTQRLWKLKISWDEPVDEATHREWQDGNQPQMKWKMGKVTSVFPGNDGLVRAVDVFSGGSTYRRSINKIALLPIDDNTPVPNSQP
ncbi:uncharacterized protein LOC126560464 [Anopheles maculipalpis]|uniref:uncharacterized protein LOC126560464 n=1 Tax=Anopheles maculipalpis TaxID=1496333 RepID=UPI0021594BEA|nr:uncharacterized protein LOC126560464 [Anopheles maculipalpis]